MVLLTTILGSNAKGFWQLKDKSSRLLLRRHELKSSLDHKFCNLSCTLERVSFILLVPLFASAKYLVGISAITLIVFVSLA